MIILGVKYKLVREDVQKSGLYGFCDRENKLIVVDKKLKGKIFNETIVHELIHALLHEASISPTLENAQEEIICDLIAKCLEENFVIKRKIKR